MGVLKSKGFLAAVTVFLLVSIPVTTYVVLRSDETSRTPKASTTCESNCVASQSAATKVAEEASVDLNADGVVDSKDWVIVTGNMGKTGENSADLNNDQKVDEADVLILTSRMTKSQ